MEFDIKPGPQLHPRLLKNARVLQHRNAILPLLPKHKTIVEIGVALGDFSEQIIKICKPSSFIAIDIFQIHTQETIWGKSTKEIFNHGSHLDYFTKRFQREINSEVVSILEGDSVVSLEKLPDHSVDIVYIDANHSYEAVSNELTIVKRKIKDTGYIILNDYTLVDPFMITPYGVIQATNEFMIEENWEMIYFALEKNMFCDVVLRKLRRQPDSFIRLFEKLRKAIMR